MNDKATSKHEEEEGVSGEGEGEGSYTVSISRKRLGLIVVFSYHFAIMSDRGLVWTRRRRSAKRPINGSGDNGGDVIMPRASLLLRLTCGQKHSNYKKKEFGELTNI